MGFTRRKLMTRMGLAFLAAAGLRLAPAGVPRRNTYLALVEAVGRATRSQVDPARAEFAADWLRDEHYPGSLPSTRRAIDDVLDRLEASGFSRLDPPARIALLRELDGDLAARAVALAAAPFHPAASDYHPTPVVL
jgi:hypothetical protein